ncbi:hypothetical protein C7M56_18390 [Clostridium botulinum]|uniref:Uncharacterized protein n=1 Tax=Clostridium botulinum TaxID=1491 RepID=A0ABC8CY10_CLOBO|nr:DUF5677 domain-containing protein [Clostridium botulinum]AVQ40531.1 hypothetical protein C7M56_18390 [Clostridium botulinum]
MSDRITELFHDASMKVFKEQLEKAETQEEADKMMKKFEEVDLTKIFTDMCTKMAYDTTKYMRNTMHEEVMQFRADEQEFIAHQEQKWCKAFMASESMYIIVLEAAESYIKYVNQLSQEELKKHYYTFTAMLHIHGRAMQQFLEIITLMKNGFADGSYARWRSMYELTIISSFITKHGESVAKAFIESSKTEDRYEWARISGVFPVSKKYITFNDIQKQCDIDSTIWRHQYDLANKTVHASPQGTFARMSNMEINDIIPVGRSDYGITTPAEHSAISLAQITSMFFTIHPSCDNLLAVKCINNWINIIREIYFKTHDLIFQDDEKLWSDDMISYESEINEHN